MANVSFITGTEQQYTNLATKDSNSLYFLSNGKVYKGSTLLSNNVIAVADGNDFPTSGAVAGTFYIKSTGECAYYNGTNYVLISGFALSELETLENRINSTIESALVSTYGLNKVSKLIDRSITSISNNEVTSIGTNAFANCDSLTTALFPNATYIGGSAFNSCSALTTANLPKCTFIGPYAFKDCTSLTTAEFPKLSRIETRAFHNCGLTTFILSNDSVATLVAGDAFSNTPISSGTGYIYVPDDLVSSYQSANNWSEYSARFKGLSELSE